MLVSEIIRIPIHYRPLGEVIAHLVAAFGLFGVVYWFRTKLDKETMSSIGIALRLRHALWGGLIAIIAISILFIVLLLFQQISVDTAQFSSVELLLGLISYIFVGFFEELVFRGYIQTNLSRSITPTWGLIISSLLFALIHGFNPDLSLLGLFNIFLAGFLLGMLYQLTGNLWGAIGFHALWNFWQGPVLGFAVSGTDSYSVLAINNLGADYYTGGAFGLEGSVVCTVVLVAVMVLVQYRKGLQPTVAPIG